MSIDDRGRRAANEMRNARREARFTTRSPAEGGPPSLWPILATAVVAVVALIGLAQLFGNDDETVTGTTAVDTTVRATSTVPSTTVPPSTAAPTTTVPPTTEAPTTTAPPTSTTPSLVPDRAIGQDVGDLVWIDTTSGETEIIHQELFEAEALTRLALNADRSRLYYQLNFEDNWFTCESVGGEVTIMDLASGDTTTVADGLPALSPDGRRLAYLGSAGEGCLPDPSNPSFFVPAYDTLFIADRDGNELLRFPLDGEVGSPEQALRNLVWLDDLTLLVSDGSGVHYRIPAYASNGAPIEEHETMNLPEIDLFAVVDGRGIGARFDPATGYGPLQIVDMGTGALAPIEGEPHGDVGVSADGVVIIGSHTPRAQLLTDVDLATGEVAQVIDIPELFNGIDW